MPSLLPREPTRATSVISAHVRRPSPFDHRVGFSNSFTRLLIGSLALRPAILLFGNSRPRITPAPLPHATKAYGQLLGRDFNPLDTLLLLRTVKPCLFPLSHGALSRGFGQLITPHEHVSRNTEPFGQSANHFERQWPYPIEYFGHARARSDVGREVLSSHCAGFHYMKQKLDRVRIGDRIVFGLRRFESAASTLQVDLTPSILDGSPTAPGLPSAQQGSGVLF